MTLEERVREKVKEARDYYLYNQDKLRAPLFRRFCEPARWETQWRELWRVIEEYEKYDGELGNKKFKVEETKVKSHKWTPFLQSWEIDALQNLIAQRCTSQERNTIANNIGSFTKSRVANLLPHQKTDGQAVWTAAQRGVEEGLLEAFGIEYRREYQLVLDKAERLWTKSGMDYFVEFAIIECGIIDVEQIKREEIRALKPKLSGSITGRN
jgi:hypothetical protein